MHSQAHQESPTDTRDHYSATGHLDEASQAAENFHDQVFGGSGTPETPLAGVGPKKR